MEESPEKLAIFMHIATLNTKPGCQTKSIKYTGILASSRTLVIKNLASHKKYGLSFIYHAASLIISKVASSFGRYGI